MSERANPLDLAVSRAASATTRRVRQYRCCGCFFPPPAFRSSGKKYIIPVKKLSFVSLLRTPIPKPHTFHPRRRPKEPQNHSLNGGQYHFRRIFPHHSPVRILRTPKYVLRRRQKKSPLQPGVCPCFADTRLPIAYFFCCKIGAHIVKSLKTAVLSRGLGHIQGMCLKKTSI